MSFTAVVVTESNKTFSRNFILPNKTKLNTSCIFMLQQKYKLFAKNYKKKNAKTKSIQNKKKKILVYFMVAEVANVNVL